MTPVLELFFGGQPDPRAPVVERVAVRGVLLRAGALLMLRSRHGDLKFPGGGVEPGESHETALCRELAEECGIGAVSPGEHLLTIIEYAPSTREPGSVFTMMSHYLCCTSEGTPSGQQRLDAYEAELRLTPLWIDPAEALRRNEYCLATGVDVSCPWLRREILALQHLITHA
jgi:8-oxo-dGTP pyrophosphatase MutT (NUDIX family)